MAALRGGVKDRIIHEIGRAIKQAQLEWCGVGCIRACTGRWLVLSLDAALLHGLHSLSRGYWPVVAALLDKQSLTTISALPYATKALARGRSWVCLFLNEGQLESYLHVLTSHRLLLQEHYGSHALLRDPHRSHILLMLVAGLEHLKFSIPMDVPGWMQAEGSLGSSSGTSMNSMSVSMTSMGSTLPSPSQQDPFDLDTSCSEALEESWASRRKRHSRSSSRSSSHLSSGVTTPVESEAPVTNNVTSGQLPHDAASLNQRISFENLGTIPFDSRTDVPHGGKVPKSNCDNFDKNINNISRGEKNVKDSVQYKEKLLREINKENCLFDKENVNSSVKTERTVENEGFTKENFSREEGNVSIRRRHLPSAKNTEKRVSFTDEADVECHKTMHNRLSLCGDLSKGAEIRDLSDLRDLLSSLKNQGLLPVSLALDELFASLDQSSPALSERAPPEGQEDPPLHQSITSLASNNNNSVNDDSNNNNDNSDSSGTLVDDQPESKEGAKEQGKDEEKHIGCISDRSNIIDGVRWEELTKIGQKMLEEGGVEKDVDGQPVISHRNPCTLGNQEHFITGTRPKLKQGFLSKTDSQLSEPEKDSNFTRIPQREKNSYRKGISSAERRRIYYRNYREAKKLPSLYIPIKVDSTKYKEEEDRLALEVAQGQSNLTVSGHATDAVMLQRIATKLFTSAEEKLYRLFSVREGHSSGSSTSVQVVLSSQALYVVTPMPREYKSRHAIAYHDIHTIIVGANDQWVCVLSKEAVCDDLATMGTNTGIQLEVGDPEITHALVSCLEIAVRRYIAGLKLGTKERTVESSSDKKKFYPTARKEFLQEFTRECVDNFSNSLLEESLLNAWDTRKDSVDVSQGSSNISQDSSAVSPASIHTSQESTDTSHESTDVSEVSNDASQASTEVSQTSTDISRVSSNVSQLSSDVSHVSSDTTRESTDTSQPTSDMSHSSSDETPSSSDMIQSLSNMSQESFDAGHIPVDGSEELSSTSQHSGDKIKGSKRADYTCPVELNLQKQDGLYRYTGSSLRWNGTLLDRSLPAVLVHPAWELAGLRRWLRAQLRLKNNPEVIGYWLADWEDGSSLGGGDAFSGPLGPANEGPLMFKPPGILMSWRPAYFILKAGVLYQFNDARERLPHMIVEVVQCVGCVRISSSQRPHAFQLLRKNEPPLMLAASDEHQASLWLQAFLMIINSGVRDISERTQVPCRVILLESGVLLAQQSDLILGSPPEVAPQNNQDNKSSSVTQHSQQILETTSAVSSTNNQVQWEKRDVQKPVNQVIANLKDRKPLSSSQTSLNRTNSTSSVPGSPVKRVGSGERSSTPKHSVRHQRHSSLSRLSDCGIPDIKPDIQNINESNTVTPEKRPTAQRQQTGDPTDSRVSQLRKGFQPKGEVKVLTFSALEHLSSVSVYAECPSTCLMEFECSEAGEISGDWALYFRSGSQLQQFITILGHTWKSVSQMEFPLHTVDNAGVQQFLLEGSQISSNRWSYLHL
ncbi:uncharacterized protein [Panulirus ornatus]|uniref:uncharacterized protein isoform X2 n=1 Tax=Panulirus ornatus TaxID=150431 RepID=UPI003A8806E3